MDFKPVFDYIDRIVKLNESEKENIASRLKLRRYLKNQFLVQQGDVCKFLSFVVKGCLITFHTDSRGQDHIIRFSIEDWWVADMASFVNRTPAECSVKCLEGTELIQLSWDSMNELYNEVPKFERLFRITYQNAFNSAEKRTIMNLSLPAQERYEALRQQYPHLEQRVPQYLIASYLGITKQFLSEIRQRMASGGSK